MKTVVVPRTSRKLNALLKQASEDDLIVRDADGSEFLLTALDDFEEEVRRTAANKGLMKFLAERAKQTETIPLEEVKRRLELAKASRKGQAKHAKQG